MGSGKNLLIFSSFSRACRLSASLGSMCRNVTESCIWPSSEDLLSFRAAQDAQLLPVFGHGSPRDVDVLIAQELDDLLVRMWVLGILRSDDCLDLVLHGFGRDLVAVHARDAGVEEELELEET